jgi:hypothetical protein
MFASTMANIKTTIILFIMGGEAICFCLSIFVMPLFDDIESVAILSTGLSQKKVVTRAKRRIFFIVS